MKSAVIVETIRRSGLKLAVLQYADGRFGFDYYPPGEERRRVRKRRIEDAVESAKAMIGATNAGKLDALSIDRDEFAEFLRWKDSQRPAATVPDLVASFIASKRSKGRAGKTIRDLDGTLSLFAKRFPCPIADLSREQVEAWLNSRDVGPRRWNNMHSHIVSLYRRARQDRLIGAELHPVETIEKKQTRTRRETYSPAEFAKMLAVAESRDIPFLVLGGLCGMRPEEIRPDIRSEKPAIRWENFLWERKKIDVPPDVSKTGRRNGYRRFVPLCDAALAFLAPWRRASGECVARCDVSKVTRRIASSAELTWKFDALRHSYASYRLALSKDIGALAEEMGNSARMIRNHYLDLKHEDEAEEWFAVRPAGRANVISFGT